MMDSQLLSNVLAWSVQVAAVAVVGTLLPLVIRMDSARVRYVYWRALVLLCVLLPWLQGRPAVPAAATTAPPAAFVATSEVVDAAPAAPSVASATIDWSTTLMTVFITGVMVRALWVGVGLLRLRRLRRAGETAADSGHDALQETIGTHAVIRYVGDLDQPLTFGLWRPVVLLPQRLREQQIEIQRAVLCHELLHVKRRDWAWLLAEEAVRVAVWFHPGIWWLIARLQLAREEVVDQLAVSMIGGRRVYIEALLAFADETALGPAPAFARRHHLFRRILLLSKEVVMSPRRIAFTCMLAALIVSAGTAYVVQAVPLTRVQPVVVSQASEEAMVPPVVAVQVQAETPPAPEFRRAVQPPGSLRRVQQAPAAQTNPITPENPIPRRLASVNPSYPAQHAGSGLIVAVSVWISLDQSGAVADARVLSAVQMTPRADNADLGAFGAAALDAARRWLYAPPANPPIGFTVLFTFRERAVESVQGGELRAFPPFAVAPVPADGARGGRTGGSTPSPGSALERARELLRSAQQRRDAGSVAPTPGAGGTAAPGLLAPPPEPPVPGAPIRVGGAIRPPVQVRRVNPVYPPIAQNARVQGVVILELQVGIDGSVTDARVLRSIPLLDQAAIEAVMQWQYAPTLLNGAPVPISMTVTVQFTLPESEPAPQPAN